MKRNQFVLTFALVSLILSLSSDRQAYSAGVENLEIITESRTKYSKASEPTAIQPKSAPDAKNLLPRISFEKTVFDLGDVGQGTRNSCEFRFTNTGRGLLKIGKISRTCGCTVFQLDKKEYAPNETGTIKGIKGVRLPRTYRVSAGVLFSFRQWQASRG